VITAIRVEKPDSATLLEIREEAERMGLVLVTDGRELAYARPEQIPPGHLRFAMFDKDAARPLDPKVTACAL
jgi:hypothetical protein